MSATTSFADFQAALSLLNHVHFNPIIGALVRHDVADHLEPGPLAAEDLAHRSGMDVLALTRARFGHLGHLARLMRYLPAYSPITRSLSCFAINPVDYATSRSTTPLSTTLGRRQPWVIAS